MRAVKLWCVLLLALSSASAGRTPDRKCPSKEGNEQKCASKDLLLGWLSVANRIAVRAEEVKQNATAITKRVSEVRKNATAAAAKVQETLDVLKKQAPDEKTGSLQQISRDINSAVARANSSAAKAKNAAEVASTSIKSATSAFGFVSLAVRGLTRYDLKSVLDYNGAKSTVDKIVVDDKLCPNKHNVSKRLSQKAEELVEGANLIKWKKEMVDLLNSTHEEVQSNDSICHWTFISNDNEKLKNVINAVEDAVKELMIAVESFNAAYAEEKIAAAAVNNATNEVHNINESITGSVKQASDGVCDVIGRHTTVLKQLEEGEKRINDLKIRTSEALEAAVDVQARVAAARSAVQNVKGNISHVPDFVRTVASEATANSHDLDEATRRITDAVQEATLAEENFAQASSAIAEIGIESKSANEGLMGVEKELMSVLNAAKVNLTTFTAEECKSDFSELLKGPWAITLDTAASLNTSALLELNNTLRGLEKRASEINTNITNANKRVQKAVVCTQNASRLGNEAVGAAKDVVGGVLEQMASRLCEAAADLRDLRGAITRLGGRAANIEAGVSAGKSRAYAIWKNASDVLDMPQYVEEGFTLAEGRVMLLVRLLGRANARYNKVAAEFTTTKLKDGEVQKSEVYDIVQKFVSDVSSTVSEGSAQDACDASRITQLVQSLKAIASDLSLLNDASIIKDLSQFSKSINKGAVDAHQLVQKAIDSASVADAALAEAIRRMHDESAKRQCSPLYRQLLSALGRIW
ncbi:hypothetical protein TRVL_06562 [Trypanosoma vivax]|nr:hypothetical protein TRVL_06562 [Trypanosoma vivax]